MNNKKAKIIGFIIGVFAFVVLIAGATYAWLAWTGRKINIAGTSQQCFDINYTVSRNIGTSNASVPIKYQSNYTGSQYAEVVLGVAPSCTGVTGKGTIYLTTTNASNAILKGGLYYTVVSVSGSTETVLSEGAITQTAEEKLLTNINVTNTAVTYRVYLWINGDYADESYLNATYSGEIGAEVMAN